MSETTIPEPIPTPGLSSDRSDHFHRLTNTHDEDLVGSLVAPTLTVEGRRATGRRLLERFGSVRALFRAARRGERCLVPLAGALELLRRHQYQQLLRGEVMSNPGRVAAFLHASLTDRSREYFACLFLDARHRVLSYEELFNGGMDGAQVHPSVVATRALQLGSTAIIVAHNHPSGADRPSDSDRLITGRLAEALAVLDIRLLDHFIVGDGKPVSMAECGWFNPGSSGPESGTLRRCEKGRNFLQQRGL